MEKSTVSGLKAAVADWDKTGKWQFRIIPMDYNWGRGVMGLVVDIKAGKTMTMVACSSDGIVDWDPVWYREYLGSMDDKEPFDTPEGIQELLMAMDIEA